MSAAQQEQPWGLHTSAEHAGGERTGERMARPHQQQCPHAFHCLPQAEGCGLQQNTKCPTWDGLKSQMLFALPCVTWPLPQAAGEEPSQGRGLPGTQAPMGPLGDQQQSLVQ